MNPRKKVLFCQSKLTIVAVLSLLRILLLMLQNDVALALTNLSEASMHNSMHGIVMSFRYPALPDAFGSFTKLGSFFAR